MTIAALKLKLATHTGTSAEDMALTLSDGAGGAPAIPLTDPARPLGFYSPEDGATLRVTDTNPHSLAATGWLEDTSKVEKYVMSDAEYAGREGTYRAYKEERRKVRGEKKRKKRERDEGLRRRAARARFSTSSFSSPLSLHTFTARPHLDGRPGAGRPPGSPLTPTPTRTGERGGGRGGRGGRRRVHPPGHPLRGLAGRQTRRRPLRRRHPVAPARPLGGRRV